jgi:hypothetical protein
LTCRMTASARFRTTVRWRARVLLAVMMAGIAAGWSHFQSVRCRTSRRSHRHRRSTSPTGTPCWPALGPSTARNNVAYWRGLAGTRPAPRPR